MMPFGLHSPEIVIILIISLISLVIYCIPIIIAVNRHVDNKTGIILLNIFGGWTVVGWIVALVWAVNNKKHIDVCNEEK
jgi:hypothetical protein